MPWTVAEVDRFKKGLTDKEKERWVRIANSALKSCLEKNESDELDCEVKAIKQANGSFSETKPDFANFSNPLRPKDHSEPNRFTFAEVLPDDTEYQLAFPIGAFKTGQYGEVIITRTFAERMVENWKAGALGNRNVYMDTNHDFGEACAWADGMRVTDEGLTIKWDFNSRGHELIADRRYKYYSAAIGWTINMDTGDEIFPVLIAVSLTNDPVMNTMPEAHLSTATNSAHSDGENNIDGEDNMKTLSEIIQALLALSDDEKGKATDADKQSVLKAFGVKTDDPDERGRELNEVKTKLQSRELRLSELEQQNTILKKELADIKAKEHQTRKTDVIATALSEGRILPINKEKWEAMYDKDPDGTADLLASKGKEIDLSEHGNGKGGEEAKFSAEEIKEFHKLGLTDEDIKKYGGAI